MTKTAFIACSFTSSIDDMKRADQKSIGKVLAVMNAMKHKRFSAFEASDNPSIARTMTQICHGGYIVTDHSCGYPWTKFTLTQKGLDAIAKEST